MDSQRFATLSSILTHAPSRRHVLLGLAGLGIALGATWRPEDADAKKKTKKKKAKKAQLCLDGQTVEASGKKKKKLLKGGATPGACASTPSPPPPPPTRPPSVPNAYGCLSVEVSCTSAAECCSNICEGGVCRGHDAGTCKPQPGFCLDSTSLLLPCNNVIGCVCMRTTADSLFCAEPGASACAECQRDADCTRRGFPAGSACIPVGEGACTGACESGMLCAAPCAAIPDTM